MIAIPIVLVGLVGLVSWLILFGLRSSWQYVVSAIAHIVKGGIHLTTTKVGPFSLISLGRAKANTRSMDDLGHGAQGSEGVTAGFVAGMAAVAEYHAFTQKYLAFSTLEALIAIPRYTVPKGVRTGTKPAREQSDAASKRSRAAARGAAAAEAGAISARRAAERAASQAKVANAKATAATHAPAIPLPRSIPDVWRKETEAAVPRWINKHLRWIAGGIAAYVGTGVVLRVLTRHMPWFRCNNNQRFGKEACRSPFDLFDNLLGIFTLFGVSLSIREFAESVQEFTDGAEKAIRFGISEFRQLPETEFDNASAFLALLEG